MKEARAVLAKMVRGLAIGLIFLSPPVPAAESAETAIVGATVIDATGAPARPDQTVLVRNGRIAAIGDAAKLPVPRSAKIVEARGKYLVPGLWDLHVHLHFATDDALPVFVANGVTGIRELNTPMPEIRRLRSLAEAGALVTPRIVASGKMIEAGPVKDMIRTIATPLIVDYSLGDRVFVNDAREAKAAVRALAAEKPDLIKLHVNMKRDVYFAVLEEARWMKLSVAAHYPVVEEVSLREIADAGQGSVEHSELGAAPGLFAGMSETERLAFVAYIRKSGLTFVPTLILDRNDEDKGSADVRLATAERDPRARYISPYLRAAWRDLLKVEGDSRVEEGLNLKPDHEGSLALLRALYKGGVPILPGTDFTVSFIYPGSSLHEEMVELQRKLGMTPHDVLQSATRKSAELVGLQGELGTVERGKIADLVLLDADPLTDIANVGKVEAVFRDGRYYDRAALDHMLDEAAEKIRQSPADGRKQ